jgi:RNA polymerase sigma factor (sigma-70 family)
LDAALRDAQRGDVSAFNTLVLAHQRTLYNVCYRTLGSAEDAADATQDAFLNAFRNLKSFNGPSSGLKAWLLRIAINACYDHLRRRQRRPSESLERLGGSTTDDHPTSAADRVVDPTPGPEQRSLGSETAAAIQAAIDRLPPEQRMTVTLCDVQGLSYEEAAQAMSVELGTVKSRLSRARAQLRDMLTQKGELPASSQRLAQ